ncbi:hypothetical protein JCM10450v2_003789 [Rhodotorula kratochvilovae]
MSTHEALFHCSCTSPFSHTRPPPADPPLSHFQHHPLADLLFCEDCDAIRCNSCATCEVACYFCPNCLFEVPSASVRGEKNRCARNCFQCPACDHTLSVVASDPDPSLPLNTAAASVGEPPYLLSCNFCGWDSKEVGITFEKPTGLSLQLQKAEEPSADLLEFDHIKDHLEPFLRRSQAHSSNSPHGASAGASSSSAVVSAASAQLYKDIPGFSSRYGGTGSLFAGSTRARHGGGEAASARDELERYASLYPARGGGPGSEKENRRVREDAKGKSVDRDAELVQALREMTELEEVASVDRRWAVGWNAPVLSRELRPARTPLHAKLSKRCPVCAHILIKPEQKSSSTRFKIKLVAANYLPSISIVRRPPASIGSRLSAIAAGTASGMRRTPRSGAGGRSAAEAGNGADEEPLRPGRTAVYELSFANPLYEPIHVSLAVARPGACRSAAAAGAGEEGAPPAPPPFAVNIPSPTFPISAYAEDWEYEDHEEDLDEGDEPEGGEGRSSPTKRKRKGGPGIVERRMNRTTVLMEVAVSKEAVGPLWANMLVTYVYQADDGVPPSPTKSPQKGKPAAADVKSFSFWALVPLGTVVARPQGEGRRLAAASTASA